MAICVCVCVRACVYTYNLLPQFFICCFVIIHFAVIGAKNMTRGMYVYVISMIW